MDLKKAVWWGMIIGSTAGGFIPELWGASLFSFSSLLFTAVGGFGGMWVGYKLAGY